MSLFIISSCNKEQDNNGTTIDENFVDNRLRVVLTKEATLMFKEYTALDFSEIGATSVIDLMPGSTELAKKQVLAEQTGDYSEIQEYVDNDRLLDLDTYKILLSITLDKKSKENVLRVIEILKQRDDVEDASPDYYGQIGPINLNNDNLIYER